MRFFRCVAFWAEPDHYQAPLLNFALSTVRVDSSLDFGIVGHNSFVDVPMELREVVGVGVGFVSVGSRRWKGYEVDG